MTRSEENVFSIMNQDCTALWYSFENVYVDNNKIKLVLFLTSFAYTSPSEKDRLIKFKLLDFSRYLSEFYQNFTKNNFVQDLPAKMFVFVFYVYVTK